MTGRTSLPTHDLDELVPALTRQGIDATERELVLEVTETRTVTRRITVRPATPETATTLTQTKEEKEHEWDNLEP